MDGRGTFNLLGIVDDEIAVPYDGEVHCQVTDLHTLIHVLKRREREGKSGGRDGGSQRDRVKRERKKWKKRAREKERDRGGK